MRRNVRRNAAVADAASRFAVRGLEWGDATLTRTLAPVDLILVSDCLYYAAAHEKLARTVGELLPPRSRGAALFAFAHHIVEDCDRDIRFFLSPSFEDFVITREARITFPVGGLEREGDVVRVPRGIMVDDECKLPDPQLLVDDETAALVRRVNGEREEASRTRWGTSARDEVDRIALVARTVYIYRVSRRQSQASEE